MKSLAAAVFALLAFGTIRVQRLALGGAPMLPGDGVIASISRASQEDAAVARCAGFDAVAWFEVDGELRRRVMLRRFTSAGQPLGPAMQIGAGPAVRTGVPSETVPTVTCGPTNALVTWTGSDGDDVSGAVFDAFSSPRAVPLLEPGERLIDIVFDGTHFVGAVFHGNLHLVRWNEKGQRTGGSRFFTAAFHGGLAWNGEEFLLVAQYLLNPTGLMGYRFDRNLVRVGEPILIHESDTILSLAPKVAGAPDAWLVGWTDPDDRSAFVARIHRDGTPLDALHGVPAASTPIRHVQWNGTRWEILTSSGVISCSRGGVLDQAYAMGEGERLYGVTHTGPSRLIVYSRVDPVDGVYELYGDVVEPEWTVNAPRRRTARH